eukprot:gene8478-biopygen4633
MSSWKELIPNALCCNSFLPGRGGVRPLLWYPRLRSGSPPHPSHPRARAHRHASTAVQGPRTRNSHEHGQAKRVTWAANPFEQQTNLSESTSLSLSSKPALSRQAGTRRVRGVPPIQGYRMPARPAGTAVHDAVKADFDMCQGHNMYAEQRLPGVCLPFLRGDDHTAAQISAQKVGGRGGSP